MPFHIKDHGARRVPLPAHTIDLLTQFHAKAPEGVPYILLSEERYKQVKSKWQQFRKIGKPWLNRYMVNNVLRDFRSHYKRAGIKPVGKLTIHTLRKSCGQNRADNLPMNVVKELMGHSNSLPPKNSIHRWIVTTKPKLQGSYRGSSITPMATISRTRLTPE